MVAVFGVTAACYVAARPTPGIGITLPAFIPPLAVAGLALMLAPAAAAAVAYLVGALGALMGADLPHLRELVGQEEGFVSIGRAGVDDGIFLASIVAVILTGS